MTASDELRRRADWVDKRGAWNVTAAELRALADLVEASANWVAIADDGRADAMDGSIAVDRLSQALAAVERIFSGAA